MNLRHLTYLMVAMLGLTACGGAGTVATGSLTSGTPQDTASGDTTTTGSTGATEDDVAGDDGDKIPADVTDPPTVDPPPQDPYSPPSVVAVCGNGSVESDEQCDDGNTSSWDGCTSLCKTEAAPTISDQFETATNSTWSAKQPHGTVTFAATDALASDQKIAKLTFSGGQSNAAGPGNSTEIYTKSLLGFGMYRARFDFAKCNSGEDLTNGIFVYSYGGTNGLPSDSNSNGITDNNEIDIELWCGNSKKLYLTTWTDYEYDSTTDTETFRKYTRVIDLNTGKAYETPDGEEDTYDIDYSTVKETIPEMALPTLATDDVYYEMGFEWHATSLRYFIVLNGKEVTLWNYSNANYIPQNKAKMMFNVWYPSWSGKAYPASDQSLKVDWFKYWAE